MTIHHDPSPLNVDESPSEEEEEEEEEETDDELETDEEDEDGNMMTLQLVARLLGGNLMRIRRRVNNPNMCHQPESERIKGKIKRYTFIHF